ncbi:hypothetical protein [Flavobacterium sp. ZB4P13]|uniref:hypothetical protein n=1 Tax=Flavobacterium sp. ZB4P13 TaxID=3401728 RepID=UPI003AAD17C9
MFKKININLKEFYKLERLSLLLLVLPYIAINWGKIYNVGFFTYPKMGLVLLLLILSDLVFKTIIKENSKIGNYFTIVLVTIVILFFYGDMFLLPSVLLVNNFFETVNIRYRWVFIFYFLLIFFVQLYFLKINKKIFKVVNSYCIILFFIVIGTYIYQKQETSIKNINTFKNSPILIEADDTVQKPILLLITDEYASPDEVFKIVKDSSVYNYSNSLYKAGWVTKNSFYSFETSTINSLSSLFNFNLSKSKDYFSQPIITVATQKLLKCALYDSIQEKKGHVINYGIFDVGESKPFSRLYSYPENFKEQLLLGSSFFSLIMKKGVLETSVVSRDDYPFENHNKNILNKMNILELDAKTVLYAHLFLPHNPFVFNPEFKFRKINTANYIAYWNFTNVKMTQLLKSLTKENKYRIIITGDHGYRSDKRINPHNTFTAFWGFDKASIEKMHSVQDLGSLINGYIFK